VTSSLDRREFAGSVVGVLAVADADDLRASPFTHGDITYWRTLTRLLLLLVGGGRRYLLAVAFFHTTWTEFARKYQQVKKATTIYTAA